MRSFLKRWVKDMPEGVEADKLTVWMGSLMVAVSSPQSPPVDPKYQMEAFLEFVNAAPLPLNSKPNVSN